MWSARKLFLFLFNFALCLNAFWRSLQSQFVLELKFGLLLNLDVILCKKKKKTEAWKDSMWSVTRLRVPVSRVYCYLSWIVNKSMSWFSFNAGGATWEVLNALSRACQSRALLRRARLNQQQYIFCNRGRRLFSCNILNLPVASHFGGVVKCK